MIKVLGWPEMGLYKPTARWS